jgi:hypothetical protein
MPQLVQGVYAALVVVPASRELEASVVVAANEVHDVATAWVARDLHRVIGHRAAVRQVVASFIRSDCFGSLPRFLLFDDGTVGFGELRGRLRLIAFTFPFRSASTFDAIRTDRIVLHNIILYYIRVGNTDLACRSARGASCAPLGARSGRRVGATCQIWSPAVRRGRPDRPPVSTTVPSGYPASRSRGAVGPGGGRPHPDSHICGRATPPQLPRSWPLSELAISSWYRYLRRRESCGRPRYEPVAGR